MILLKLPPCMLNSVFYYHEYYKQTPDGDVYDVCGWYIPPKKDEKFSKFNCRMIHPYALDEDGNQTDSISLDSTPVFVELEDDEYNFIKPMLNSEENKTDGLGNPVSYEISEVA